MLNIKFTSKSVYRYDANRCPACSSGISKTEHLGLYMIGPLTAIAYWLCKQCGKESRKGLSEVKLAQVNQRLDAFAVRAGLAKEGVGHA